MLLPPRTSHHRSTGFFRLGICLLSLALTSPSLAQPTRPVPSKGLPNRSPELLQLERTLKAQNCALADRLTRDYLQRRVEDLIQPIHKNHDDHTDAMKRLPCRELDRIDRAWQTASQGKFGLTVQARIQNEVSREPDPLPAHQPNTFLKLSHRVGWLPKIDQEWSSSYLIPEELNYSRSASDGYLPAIGVWYAVRWPAEVYGTAFLDTFSAENINWYATTLLERVATCSAKGLR